MGTKRSHNDISDPQPQRSHRKALRHQGQQDTKPRHRPAPSPNPLNPLKARIRSLRRLLSHDDSLDSFPRAPPSAIHPDRAALLAPGDELDIATRHAKRDEERGPKRLPAGVRAERERELEKLEGELRDAEGKRRRSEVIGKWHKVRFFERRKAERRLGRIRRAGGEEGEAMVDLNYALYWPLEREYVPLWPRRKEGEEEGGEEERKGDGEMWKLVERCMREGRLEELREGRVEGCGVEKVEKKEEERKKERREKKEKKKVVVEEDEDSDGGFFE